MTNKTLAIHRIYIDQGLQLALGYKKDFENLGTSKIHLKTRLQVLY